MKRFIFCCHFTWVLIVLSFINKVHASTSALFSEMPEASIVANHLEPQAIDFEIAIVPTLNDGVLEISIETRSFDTPFAFGNSKFTLNLNKYFFQFSKAQFSATGPWDSAMNPLEYNNMTLVADSLNSTISFQINKKATGTGTVTVPNTWVSIAKISVPYITSTQETIITWRTFDISTYISNWSGIDITNAAVKISSPYFILCTPPSVSLAVTPNDSLCSGNLAVFTATVTGACDSIYYLINDKVVHAGDGTSNAYGTTMLKNGDVVYAVVSNLGCKDTSNKITIYIPPFNSSIDGKTEVCTGIEETYQTSNPEAGKSYLWSVTGGTIVGPNNLQSVTVTWDNGNTGNISLKESKDGCDTLISVSVIKSSVFTYAPSVSVTSKSGSSLTFGWFLDSKAEFYEISTDSVVWTMPNSGVSSHTISGLANNTTVCVWVRAINDCDTVVSSKVCGTTMSTCGINYFKTPDTLACAAGNVVTLRVKNIAPPSYKISWMGGAFARVDSFNVAILKDTVIYFEVADTTIAGCVKKDSIRINLSIADDSWSGLKPTYCVASFTSILKPADPGGVFTGRGVGFNAATNEWYFKPSLAGPGTHTITYSICGNSNSKVTIVSSAPCITTVVEDSTSSAVQSPQGLYTDCYGQIYVSNANNDVISLVDTLGVARVIVGDSTLAGMNVDGPVATARLHDPIGITVAPDGTIYFVDGGSHTVRMLKAGVVTTIAGGVNLTGNVPAGNTTVTGSTARFTQPFGITLGADYTKLYVSDLGNGKIREIDLSTSDYNVRTVVGGGGTDINLGPVPALSAKLYAPKHLVADSRYIYITDENAQTLYAYDFLSESVSVYAGLFANSGNTLGFTNVAQLRDPSGVTVNCNGDVYVVDKGNNSIKHVDPNSYAPNRYMSNFAGGNSPVATGDVDGTAALARFNKPQAVSVFVKGFIDIADTGNDKIKRLAIENFSERPWDQLDTVDFTYCINDSKDTLSPPCGGFYSGPGIVQAGGDFIFDPASAGVGTHTLTYTFSLGYCESTVSQVVRVVPLPVTDLGTDRNICENEFGIYELDAGPDYVSYSWTKNAGLLPNDTTQFLTITSGGIYAVTVVDSLGCATTDEVELYAQSVPPVTLGTDLTLCPGTTANLIPSSTGTINRVLWQDSTIAGTFVVNSGGIYSVNVLYTTGCITSDTVHVNYHLPPSPTITSDKGEIYMTIVKTLAGDSVNSGAVNDINPLAARFNGVRDMVMDKAGNMFVTDFHNHVIRKITPAGEVSTYAGTMGVAGTSGSTLTDSYFFNPYGIAIDRNDNLYVTEMGSHVVRRITPGGEVSVFAGVPGVSGAKNGMKDTATFSGLAGIAVDNAGNIVVADQGNNALRVISPLGQVTTLANMPGPLSVAVNVEGNIFAGNASNVYKINPFTHSYAVYASVAAGAEHRGLAIDEYSKLYVSGNTTYQISQVAPTGGVATNYVGQMNLSGRADGPSSVAQFENLFGLYIAKKGLPLYVADQHRVRSVIDSCSVLICPGEVTVLNAGAGYSVYLWNNGTTSPTLTVSDSGTYYVRVTDANGCTGVDSIRIVVIPEIEVTKSADTTICAGDTAVLNVSINSSLGSDTIIWFDPSNIQVKKTTGSVDTLKTTTGGSYTVRVINSGGCDTTFTINVTVNTISVAMPDTIESCLGTSVQLTASSGTAVSYLWTPAATLSDPTIPGPIANPTATTTYALTVEDAIGCSVTDSVIVIVYPKPVADFTTANTCSDDVVSFTNTSTISTGTFKSLWRFGDGSTSDSTNGTHVYSVPDTYTVDLIVTSNKGCADTITKPVTIEEKPEARIHFVKGCPGVPISFVDTSVISQPYTRLWNFGDPGSGPLNTSTASHPTHIYNASGTYTVNLYIEITATGCKDTATVIYEPHPKPVANFTFSAPACTGVPVDFKNNSPMSDSLINWVYFFNDPYTTTNVSGGIPEVSHVFTVAGSYNVEFRVQDNQTCFSDPYIQTIVVNSSPDVNAGVDQTICRADTITLTATSTSGSVDFLWESTGSFVSPVNNASVEVNPASSVIYIVSVANTLTNCTNKDTVLVTVVDVEASPTSGTTPLCPGASTQLHANPSGGGAAGYSFLWKPAASLSDTSIENPLASPLTVTEYTVVVTDNQYGCVDSARVTVTMNPLTVDAGADKSFCISSLGNLSGSINLTSGVTYNWTPATGLANALDLNTGLNSLPIGVYTYVLEATENVYNCTVRDTVVVSIASGPTVDAGGPTIPVCLGNEVLLGGTPVATGGGGEPYTYEWRNNTTLVSTVDKPSVSPVATTQYTLLVRDKQGCEGTDVVTVQVNPMPDVTISQDQLTICEGGSITLSADASNISNNKQWKLIPSTLLGTGMDEVVSVEGTYRLIVTNPVTSCTDSSEITLDFMSPPTLAGVSMVIPSTSCLNVPVLVEGISDGDDITYRWLTSGQGYFTPADSNFTYYVTGQGDTVGINITLEAYNMCDTVSITRAINFKAPPVVRFSASPVETFIEQPVSFVNLTDDISQSIVSWQWIMQDGAEFNVKDIGAYTYDVPNIYHVALVGTNAEGCVDTFRVTIDVIKTQLIYIPNVFSPNEINPENKVCKVYGLNVSKSDFSFNIYNRWGEVVYTTTDFHEANTIGWDGGGQATGVFTYTVKGKYIDGTPFEKTGTISLVR
ncbi:MAG TPA: PKD domain-containing protein [Cytophagaceae bacterium]